MTTVQEKLRTKPNSSWISWLVEGFASRMARRRAYLDIRDLSPYLQRDMGFLDGNEAGKKHS